MFKDKFIDWREETGTDERCALLFSGRNELWNRRLICANEALKYCAISIAL